MAGGKRDSGKARTGGIGFARDGGGESGGGAYDNPHAGKKGGSGGFMGHGGQTEQPYHGGEQLGDETVAEGGNPNSATRKAKPGDDEEQPGS